MLLGLLLLFLFFERSLRIIYFLIVKEVDRFKGLGLKFFLILALLWFVYVDMCKSFVWDLYLFWNLRNDLIYYSRVFDLRFSLIFC